MLTTAPSCNDTVSDRRLFEELASRSRQRAYSLALQLTRNSVEAEDLVQEAFLKAWRRFDTYIPSKSFLNWLLRILQRVHLDNLRRENPIRKAESIHSMVSPSDGDAQDLIVRDRSKTPDDLAIAAEFAAELRVALAELPEIYQTAIILCDMEGLSYSEIADLQGTTVGTVRSRIHRGRKLLRDIIQRRGRIVPPSELGDAQR